MYFIQHTQNMSQVDWLQQKKEANNSQKSKLVSMSCVSLSFHMYRLSLLIDALRRANDARNDRIVKIRSNIDDGVIESQCICPKALFFCVSVNVRRFGQIFGEKKQQTNFKSCNQSDSETFSRRNAS